MPAAGLELEVGPPRGHVTHFTLGKRLPPVSNWEKWPPRPRRCLPAAPARDTSSASHGFTDFSRIDMLGVQHNSVNFGAGKCPGSPNRCALLDWGRASVCPMLNERCFPNRLSQLWIGPPRGCVPRLTRGKRGYRGTSRIRNSPPPSDHHRAPGIVLL